MLSIKNIETGETTYMQRDACVVHPAWVHEQIGTDSESELQLFLDNTNIEEFAAHPGETDDDGVFMSAEDAREFWSDRILLEDTLTPTEVKGCLACGMTMADLADEFGGRVVDDVWLPRPENWWVSDEFDALSGPVEYPDSTRKEAAEEHFADGDWGEAPSVEISTWREGFDTDGDPVQHDIRSFLAANPQPEPECAEGHSHGWCAPIDVVGGIEENPGVQGHGGGVIVVEICRHCGTYRITDTWAQDAATGQIIDDNVVTYRDADEESLAWIESMQNQ